MQSCQSCSVVLLAMDQLPLDVLSVIAGFLTPRGRLKSFASINRRCRYATWKNPTGLRVVFSRVWFFGLERSWPCDTILFTNALRFDASTLEHNKLTMFHRLTSVEIYWTHFYITIHDINLLPFLPRLTELQLHIDEVCILRTLHFGSVSSLRDLKIWLPSPHHGFGSSLPALHSLSLFNGSSGSLFDEVPLTTLNVNALVPSLTSLTIQRIMIGDWWAGVISKLTSLKSLNLPDCRFRFTSVPYLPCLEQWNEEESVYNSGDAPTHYANLLSLPNLREIVFGVSQNSRNAVAILKHGSNLTHITFHSVWPANHTELIPLVQRLKTWSAVNFYYDFDLLQEMRPVLGNCSGFHWHGWVALKSVTSYFQPHILTRLELRHSSNLKHFLHCSNLQSLRAGCPDKDHPESDLDSHLSKFQKLTHLHLSGKHVLGEVMRSVEHLHSLRKLDVSTCRRLYRYSLLCIHRSHSLDELNTRHVKCFGRHKVEEYLAKLYRDYQTRQEGIRKCKIKMSSQKRRRQIKFYLPWAIEY